METIVTAVLDDPTLVRPLVITSDHGYLWQGDQCAWPLEPAERAVMAEAFQLGRSTDAVTDALAATGKVWLGNGSAPRRDGSAGVAWCGGASSCSGMAE